MEVLPLLLPSCWCRLPLVMSPLDSLRGPMATVEPATMARQARHVEHLVVVWLAPAHPSVVLLSVASLVSGATSPAFPFPHAQRP